MRGIVLAGGTGSRLGSLTKAVNKHLMPVGNQPMIYWPIKILRDNNIDDITIVSSARGVGQLAEALGGKFNYRVQDGPGGVAQALYCATVRHEESVAVILGDNVFLPGPKITIEAVSARCFLHSSPFHNLTQFGVPILNECGRIVEIIEKPNVPSTAYAVTGLYVFSGEVFRRIKHLQSSQRGELEITDLLNTYAHAGSLTHTIVDGFWGDAGTLKGMAICNEMVAKMEKQ